MPHDAVFQSQVIHETARAVIVGPPLHNHQLPDAIGSAVFVTPLLVLKIFKNSVISRVMLKTVKTLFLPDFDMVRLAALGQYPSFKITNGDQADTAAEAGTMGAAEDKER